MHLQVEFTLGIEALGRNYIDDEEFGHLVSNEATRQLVKRCTLLEKNEREELRWQFEHNNFQEYLAARALTRLPLDAVKEFLAFKPEYRKVIPSWVNTLSFLLSILKPGDKLFDEVTGWIEEIEPELFVKFEPDKIDPAKRNRIVKRIFDHYKERRIAIDNDKYRYSELARFGERETIAELLLAEAETTSEPVVVTNALVLLGFLDVPYKQRQRAHQLLIACATSADQPDYVQNRALMTLAALRFTRRDTIEPVVTALRTSDNDWVRYGLYYFLTESEYLDDYVEVFLDGIGYMHADRRIADEGWRLREGLKHVKKPQAIKQILVHYRHNSREWQHTFLEKIIPDIIANAAEAYAEDESLFHDVLGTLTRLVDDYRESSAQSVARFFNKTGTRLKAFQYVLNESHHIENLLQRDKTSRLLAALADEECLRHFVKEYSGSKITDDEVWALRGSLGYAGSDPLREEFDILINNASGGKFIPPQLPNYGAQHREKRHENFQLLFDKDGVLNKFREVFEQENKEVLTADDLEQMYIKRGETEYWSVAQFALREIAGGNGGRVSLERAIKLIDNNWEDWSIGQICEYLEGSNASELGMTDERRVYVESWCLKHLQEVDFKTAIVIHPDGSSNSSRYARRLWLLRLRLNLEYPQDVLLDMLSFDGYAKRVFNSHGQMDEESLLADNLDEDAATERTLQNLEQGISNDYVLRDHFMYCRRHSINDVVPFALREIVSGKNAWTRKDALETICDFPNAKRNLEESLPNVSDGFKWEIVEQLLKLNSEACFDFLRQTLATGSEFDKLKASQHLIPTQNIDALNYYVEHVIGSQRYRAVLGENGSLHSIKSAQAIPALTRLLDASYQDCFVHDEINRLNMDVLDALSKIAVQSAENYVAVRGAVTTYLTLNLQQNEQLRYLYRYLDNLERIYYTTVNENITITEVVQKLDVVSRYD